MLEKFTLAAMQLGTQTEYEFGKSRSFLNYSIFNMHEHNTMQFECLRRTPIAKCACFKLLFKFLKSDQFFIALSYSRYLFVNYSMIVELR